jgi:hypothetical protein
MARPVREGQPINVRVEVTITEQRAGAAPIKKTIMAVVADGRPGSVRSTMVMNTLGVPGSVPLNLDTEANILSDGKIRLFYTLQYDLPDMTPGAAPETRRPVATQIRESVTLILENGKPIVAAQSADPVGDRQVSVEVKATIMR